MAMNWKKWGLEFWASLGRHIGTAGMTWLGLGLKDGKVNWSDLWVAVLVGGILPTCFTFLQRTPTPDDDVNNSADNSATNNAPAKT